MRRVRFVGAGRMAIGVASALMAGCTVTSNRLDPTYELPQAEVQPGITVLVGDSIGLIRNKRLGLLTNHAAVDRRGALSVDLLNGDRRVRAAGARVVKIFTPEHGLRVDRDAPNIPDTVDSRTGIPVISLYRTFAAVGPKDSDIAGIDALVFDLPDIGTRTWAYVGQLVYTMRVMSRNKKPIIVLDRPNPITGFFVEGPLLDSALANADTALPGRWPRAYAIHPIPLRHGMTIAELALFYNDVLGIGADLRVVPMKGWSRDLWHDRTGIPWVRPSPNMVSLQSALLYPALVAFEGTNLSVGRGTVVPFQWVGAPWLRVQETLDLLAERPLRGLRFRAETLAVGAPGDNKYPGRSVPGIRILIINRNGVQAARLGATLLWAINRTSGDSLRVDTLSYDLRFGSPPIRRALMAGSDPDMLIDREYAAAFAFRERSRRYFLYR